MTDGIVEFIEAQLDADVLWAREASRRDEHPIPEDGVHWHWEGAHADEPAEPDPGAGPYLLTASGGYEVSLRSEEEFLSSVGPLPQFAIGEASEVLAAVAGHIIRHDPARTLAVVAFMRRIVELHTTGVYRTYQCSNDDHIQEWQCERAKEPYTEHRYCEVCGGSECVEVPLLAGIWTGRPGYKPEWRPL